MVPAGSTDDPADVRSLAFEPIQVDETTTDLEGADWRVILVLHGHLEAEAAVEQGPSILWRRQHDRVHDARGSLEILEVEHGPTFLRLFTRSTEAFAPLGTGTVAASKLTTLQQLFEAAPSKAISTGLRYSPTLRAKYGPPGRLRNADNAARAGRI